MSEGLRILITGFGPFPGAPFNPTTPLVKRLTQLRRPALDGVTLTGHIFHVTYQTVDRELPELIAQLRPQALLMFGLGHAHRSPADRDARPQCRHDANSRTQEATGAKGIDRPRGQRHAARPPHGKPAARRARHRHRRTPLARCWRLSLQLPELARDRGDAAARRASTGLVHSCSPVARDRTAREGTSDITLEQLVDAGEAMLMEMVKLTRRAMLQDARASRY